MHGTNTPVTPPLQKARHKRTSTPTNSLGLHTERHTIFCCILHGCLLVHEVHHCMHHCMRHGLSILGRLHLIFKIMSRCSTVGCIKLYGIIVWYYMALSAEPYRNQTVLYDNGRRNVAYLSDFAPELDVARRIIEVFFAPNLENAPPFFPPK